MSLLEKLEQGIAQAGLIVTADKQQKLLDYIKMIEKWNKVHNLTAVRNLEEMLTLHLLDSLVVMPFIKTDRLLDVGSGAGLPGIPLAICMPNLNVTTLDSNQKKTSFMRQVKAELGLSNLDVVSGRVESYEPIKKYEAIISRAFSDLSLFINLTKHLCVNNGVWLAMKGALLEGELKGMELELNKLPSEIHKLNVPYLNAQRHLLVISNEINL